MKSNTFWKYLKNYFGLYLTKQKNSSPKTIESSVYVWNMLLKFIMNDKKIDGSKIDFDTFTIGLVTEFLDIQETKKGWKATTRNHRLSCIRSFFKYAACVEPLTYSVYSELCLIPLKHGEDNSRVVNHMSKEVIKSLIEVAGRGGKKDFRNCFFMTLMYDVAARDCEMLQLRLSDINTENSTIYLLGKGRKPRISPLSAESILMLKKYRQLFHKNSSDNTFLFYTVHRKEKTQMSDDNVARFLDKYTRIAKLENPDVPDNVHPHMFRHSRAMHLYQDGMSLSMLSEFLGHENPETTRIYAYADTEMKRKVMNSVSEKFPLNSELPEKPVWEDDDIIKRLIRGY